MRILGKVWGNGPAKALAKDLLTALEKPNAVSHSLWEKCLMASLENVVEEELPREALSDLWIKQTGTMTSLVGLCVTSIEAALGFPEDDNRAERWLGNSFLILARLLASGPAPPKAASSDAAAPATAEGGPKMLLSDHPMLKALWEANGETRPLAERIINGVMSSLFFEGFGLDDRPGPKPPKVVTEQGVDVSVLWARGVGAAEAEDKPDPGLRSNRGLALQALTAILCAGAPASPLPTDPSMVGAKAGKEEAELKRLAEVARLAASPAIADRRALAYLTDPKAEVPNRGELLFSLLNTAMGYDPHGLGVPYAGFFSGVAEEEYAMACLQVLGLLLQDGPGASLPPEAAWIIYRPQEPEHRTGKPMLPEKVVPNAFRDLLSSISSHDDIEFLVSSIVTLLGTVSEERGTFLPRSKTLPQFLPEVVLLVFHLAANPHFLAGACSDENPSDLVDGILQLAFEETEHLREENFALITAATLLRLTAYSKFCFKLTEEYEGDNLDGVPDFEGSTIDLVMMACVKVCTDHIQSVQGSRVCSHLVDILLGVICNLSVYAADLSKETCFRLFVLFDRSGKPGVVRKGGAGSAPVRWLLYIMEVFYTVLQYQYSTNMSFVYGLVTRRSKLVELQQAVREMHTAAVAASGAEEGRGDESAENLESRVSGWSDVDLTLPGVEEAPDAGKEAHGTHAGSSGAASAPSASHDGVRIWKRFLAFLDPIVALLDILGPALEAEVEKQDLINPEDAKALLPTTVLDLLPPPHAFAMRTLGDCMCVNLTCEHCYVSCVAAGPLASAWDVESQGGVGGKKPGAGTASTRARSSSRARGGGTARERSSSRRQGGGGGGRGGTTAGGGSARQRSLSRGRRGASRGPEARAPARRTQTVSPVRETQPSEEAKEQLKKQIEEAVASGVNIAALLSEVQAKPS